MAIKEGPAAMSWKDLKIDIVVESTGLFPHDEKAEWHLKAGPKSHDFCPREK
jgi:glyceraldehyde 3-phosphate dehydrogenase